MLAFARRMSPAFNGIYLFAVVNFLIATGLSLIFLRDYIDIDWSIMVGNSLTMLATNLIYQAHLQFIHQQKKPVLISAFLLTGMIALVAIFTYAIPDGKIRSLLLSCYYCVQFFLIASAIRRFQQQTQQTIYTPLLVIAAAFSLFFVLRIGISLFSGQLQPYKLQGGLMQSLLIIFLMLYIAALDFAIVLIANGQLVQKVAELAYKDTLTTLYNRRGMDQQLANPSFFEQPLAVIMCDIDHFKAVNDRYGHHIGDIVLQSVARIIKASTRKTDICVRWGGEEFLIILPMTNEQEAFVVAEKIRLACEQQTFPEQPGLVFTSSFGISSKQDRHSFFDALINDADQALYQAKTLGRNQVSVFSTATQRDSGAPRPGMCEKIQQNPNYKPSI